MQIGTPGAAYGPGFAVSRPTMGAGTPLDGSRSRPLAARKPLQMPLSAAKFDTSVHHNELVNRMAALRVARHPVMAGPAAGPSPLMAAHQKLSLNPALATPAPLLHLQPLEAAWDEPGGSPKPLPPPTGLWGGGTRDRLARVNLARRGMAA